MHTASKKKDEEVRARGNGETMRMRRKGMGRMQLSVVQKEIKTKQIKIKKKKNETQRGWVLEYSKGVKKVRMKVSRHSIFDAIFWGEAVIFDDQPSLLLIVF